MLGKLIKNEFKATSRMFLPIYVFMLVASGFMRVMIEIVDFSKITNVIVERVISILFGLSVAMYVVAILASIFGTIVMIAKRFYDNFLKDEGYLSFTLPVTTGEHIASKAIASYLWVLGVIVIFLISMGILVIGNGTNLIEIKSSIKGLLEVINKSGAWSYVIKMLFTVIIGIYTFIMMIYTCFSVGQIWNKHRIAGAILIFFAIYTIEQIIGSIFVIVFMGSLDVTTASEASINGMLDGVGIYGIVLECVEAVVYTVLTHFMLNKKLNLE